MPTLKTGVVFEGLKELSAGFREIKDREALKTIKQANVAAAEVVIADATSRASTPLEQRAAATLAATKAVNYAAVKFGAGFAGAAGAEFGAKQDVPRRRRSGVVRGWNQFKEWRGNDDGAGYFLYPAVRANTEQIADDYASRMEAMLDRMVKARALMDAAMAA